MGRPRKSARVLELTGSYKKDPQRKNDEAPEVKAITAADAPTNMLAGPRRCFEELIGRMPEGVFTVAEVPMLEVAAELLFEARQCWAEFPAAKLGQLKSIYCQLGMTPGERTKLIAPGKPKGNKFDE